MGVQGGCEQRIEVFVKIQKKNWGGGEGGVRLGGQGGCDRRIEVFGKIHKKIWAGGGRGPVGGGGVRVDVIEELKFLGKFTKKIQGRGGGGVGLGGFGFGGGSGWM